MIREGDFKYVHIAGADGQLFDLRADPGEWKNLSGDPRYTEMGARLRQRTRWDYLPAPADR